MNIRNTEKGITLVISIIVVSTLAIVGFSLSRLVAKEAGISSTVRESLKAVYVADSGIECARYWATQNIKYFPENGSPESGFEEIKCGDEIFDLDSLYQDDSYDFSFNINGSLAEVSVSRNRQDTDTLITDLTSVGYNLAEADSRVQAFREYRIEGSFDNSAGGAKDIMIGLDVSLSMDYSRESTYRDCTSHRDSDLECAIEASRKLIEALLGEDSDRRIGFVSATASVRCTDWQVGYGQSQRCYPYGSYGHVDAYQRLDLPLTNDSNIFLDLSSGLLRSGASFMVGNYRYENSNYQELAIFAMAELSGEEVVPRFEICDTRGTRITRCPDGGFPTYRTLPANVEGGNGRDRPDDEYPDAMIIIGDYALTSYTDTDWSRRYTPWSRNTTATPAFVEVLKEASDRGIEIFLVTVGTDDESMGRLTDELARLNLSPNLYTVSSYDALQNDIIDDVLADLVDSSVIPVTEQ